MSTYIQNIVRKKKKLERKKINSFGWVTNSEFTISAYSKTVWIYMCWWSGRYTTNDSKHITASIGIAKNKKKINTHTIPKEKPLKYGERE